jgi:hypothetical protein
LAEKRTSSELKKAASRKITKHLSWADAMNLKRNDKVLFRYKTILRRGTIHYDPKNKPPEGPSDVRWFMILIRYGKHHFIPAFWRGDGWSPATAIPVKEEWQ